LFSGNTSLISKETSSVTSNKINLNMRNPFGIQFEENSNSKGTQAVKVQAGLNLNLGSFEKSNVNTSLGVFGKSSTSENSNYSMLGAGAYMSISGQLKLFERVNPNENTSTSTFLSGYFNTNIGVQQPLPIVPLKMRPIQPLIPTPTTPSTTPPPTTSSTTSSTTTAPSTSSNQ
jgi:hypothetical protein